MNAITQPIWAITPEKVKEAVQRLVGAAHPKKIILFGSRARGEEREDSDLDLVVVENRVENRVEEMVRLNRVLRGLILPVELLVIGEEAFKEWGETPGNVYYEARREGKILYEAA